MRRLIAAAVLAAALAISLFGLASPASAAGTTKVTGPLPARQGVILTGVCGFPVQLDERGGLVLTTTYDAARTPLRYEITGSQTTVLTNLANGLHLSFDTLGRTTIVPNGDGTFTATQVGSGLAIDAGTTSGDPTLAWFTGRVVSRGTLDQVSLLLDVASQQRTGVSSDICDMLVSGLKTRH
jgi:hypothetical protein